MKTTLKLAALVRYFIGGPIEDVAIPKFLHESGGRGQRKRM